MSKKRRSRYKQYVHHPRYGDRPIYSGEQYSLDEILKSYWRYSAESIFPETAIKADLAKQNYTITPRSIYVDIQKICINCGKWFLFFAKEQKYWYETLGFYVDADYIKCSDCRYKEHEIKKLFNRYEELLKCDSRSDQETSELKNIALELFQQGYIKDRTKIDGIS